MRTMDFSPLFRASVGFDRMMNRLDAAQRLDDTALGYPPYNIEKTGDSDYRITMALAGFSDDELEVTVKENGLTITGSKEKEEAGKDVEYLHRGIAARSFERRFDLADHIKVAGAKLENGLLTIELVREVPEAMKPRSIKIEKHAPAEAKVIENKAA